MTDARKPFKDLLDEMSHLANEGMRQAANAEREADEVEFWRDLHEKAMRQLDVLEDRCTRFEDLLIDVLGLSQIADDHPRGIKARIREALDDRR